MGAYSRECLFKGTLTKKDFIPEGSPQFYVFTVTCMILFWLFLVLQLIWRYIPANDIFGQDAL